MSYLANKTTKAKTNIHKQASELEDYRTNMGYDWSCACVRVRERVASRQCSMVSRKHPRPRSAHKKGTNDGKKIKIKKSALLDVQQAETLRRTTPSQRKHVPTACSGVFEQLGFSGTQQVSGRGQSDRRRFCQPRALVVNSRSQIQARTRFVRARARVCTRF